MMVPKALSHALGPQAQRATRLHAESIRSKHVFVIQKRQMLGLIAELCTSQLAQVCSISCIHAMISAGILSGGETVVP